MHNMLSLRLVRRFGIAAHTTSAILPTSSVASASIRPALKRISKLSDLDEPALFKLKKERDPEKLFNLFKANAHNKIVVENRFAFEDTVARLAGAGRFDYIENLLEQQKALPQGRREGFVVRIIMLYGMAGMIDHAVNTFYNMHLYGCCRTVMSFNAALNVLTRNRKLETIEALLQDAPSFDIQLDQFSVNVVIKACCDMGILDKAYLVMVEMEKAGVIPDVVTYTTLISAFYNAGRWEIGNGLWNLMVLRGCLPNLATFNVRIQFLVKTRRHWEANKLLNLMRQIRVIPDNITYNLVIKGFCRARNLVMANKVYCSLLDQGLKPNLKIYQTMITYLCKAGDFDLAYTMCKDCMRKNWFPSVDTIIKLLEGLQKDDKLDKARFIIALAHKRVPPFCTAQLSSMRSTLTAKKF